MGFGGSLILRGSLFLFFFCRVVLVSVVCSDVGCFVGVVGERGGTLSTLV